MEIEGLILEDKLDSDGEIEMFTEDTIIGWLTKDDAYEIVEHLMKVFKMTGGVTKY